MGHRFVVIAAAAAAMAAAVAGCGSSSSSSSTKSASTGSGTSSSSGGKGPILIGISAAKTGILAPYDLQAGQLFEMRIHQIDEQGGVLGRQIVVKWLDSKSDKATDAANTQLLLSEGAQVIIGTCDFDYGAPAVLTAVAHKTLGMFLCASGYKAADPTVVGAYGGSMGLGSDAEGAAMAEWVRATHPQWKRVFLEKDTSLEYSIDTVNYFAARFQELGGQICGRDSFVGSPTLDLSPNITRLRSAIGGCDMIYDGSWQPFGSQFVRAVRDAGINTPIISNASVNGTDVDQIAGKVSNFYAEGFACDPVYCTGTQTPLVRTINQQFQAAYGVPVGNHYAYPGYALADAIVEAIKTAGGTNEPALANAMFSESVNFFGHTMHFTPSCHRPHPAVFSIEQFTNGVDKQVGFWSVKEIPNIGDGNHCAGPQ
jgi:branched-chain amino acid transport system substrate-binding protein